MSELKDYIAQVASIVMTVLVMICRNSIVLFNYSYRTYPQFTLMLMIVLGAYLVYKLLMRMIRMWIGFLVGIIKALLMLVFICVCGAVYFRGWRFFTQDVDFIKQAVIDLYHNQNGSREQYRNGFSMINSLLGVINGGSAQKGKFGLSNVLEDYGIEIDKSYFDYVEDHFHKGDEFDFEKIGQFVSDNLGDLLEGVDMQEMSNNILGSFMNRN
mmetsp:Transcript_4823/g.5928  ORF Transcript_4823/g.5928 Transcript_4823/m.5928 type:complete len:213 (-) Transcript_4823:89-727(-)